MSEEIVDRIEEAVAPASEVTPVAPEEVASEAPSTVVEDVAPVAEAVEAPVVPAVAVVPDAEVVPDKKARAPRAKKAADEPVIEKAPFVVDFGTTKTVTRGRRRIRVGKVVSTKMQKTIVVAVESRVRHPLYGKFMKRTTKFKVHDELNTAGEGDTVEIMETRPLSAEKRWRFTRVVERAK